MSRQADQYLCEALEGSGEVLSKIHVYCVNKKGYLLLALPSGRAAAKATQNLYQPQSFKARALMVIVSILIRLGLHKLLSSRSLTIRERSVFSQMKCPPSEIGFLLGNPDAESRRAIILHAENGGFLVDKVGLGDKAAMSVSSELGIINTLPDGNVGLPVICGHQEEKTWVSYTTRYFTGRAPKASDQSRIISLLENWVTHSTTKKLGETKQWKQIEEYTKKHDRHELYSKIESASSLDVEVGVFHGDFAPWNIKLSQGGDIHVMDWEYGCAEGPQGWDWLHYMIQQASLVNHMSTADILELCRSWAKSSEGTKLLDSIGWGGHTESWLGSYLVYSSWVAGFDRVDLLDVWMKSAK